MPKEFIYCDAQNIEDEYISASEQVLIMFQVFLWQRYKKFDLAF